MDMHILSYCLAGLGPLGIIAFALSTVLVNWRYSGSRIGSFRWYARNWRLEQISALACFFSLAMAASYGLLLEPWGWLYLIAAVKTGTWWFRWAISRRA